MPKIITKKPKKQVSGAIFIRRALKISGSKPPSIVVLGPVINRKPVIIITTAMAIIMKFILPKAKFFGNMSVSFLWCILFDLFKVSKFKYNTNDLLSFSNNDSLQAV